MAILKRYPRLLLILPLFILVAGVVLILRSQVVPLASVSQALALTSQHVGTMGNQTESVQSTGAGAYSVTASSEDIWGVVDSFQCVQQPLIGNGQIVARVLGIDGTTNGWTKAGLMIRETLEPHSKHAALVGTKGNGLAFLWRSETAGASGSTHGASWTAPYWLKLVRYGNCLAGYQSIDGINWVLVDWQIIDMSQEVYVGLAVSSHDATSACSARFDQVQVLAGSALNPMPLVGNGDGLRGDYYTNEDLAGAPVMVRKDRAVNFDWDIGAPMELAQPDQFSVRWTGEIQAQFTEPYTLYVESDDGTRVWLDGNLVMDDWVDRFDGQSQAKVNLVAGQKHALRIEYYQAQGVAHARLLWSSPSTPKRPVPQSQLYTLTADQSLAEEPEEQPLEGAEMASSILSNGWQDANIGLGAGGGVETSNEVFTVTGCAQDIWGKADELHYIYQPLVGNGQVVARVLRMAGGHPWAKAGLMIRETLDPGSRHAMLGGSIANGLMFLWRAGQSNATSFSGSVRFDTPYWLKLVRWGDLVGGFVSTNGVDWQLADWERVNMGQQVYVGLAVSSHDQRQLCTAWFDQVKVSSVDAPSPLPVVGTGDGLKGDYFPNMNLIGPPALTKVDPVLNSDWGIHPPIDVPYGAEFSVRWVGEIQARFSEPYTFYLDTDDGVRVWLNEQPIINDWMDRYEGESTATVNLVAGQRYLLRIEYYQNQGVSRARLKWSSPSTTKQVVPQSQLYSQPADTDGNGLPDIWEMYYFGHLGVDPNASATTNGLSNLQAYLNGTDPLVASSAGDGIPDGWKIARGFSPTDPNVALQDPDQDGLNNLEEYQQGTDPNNADTDGDGLPDGLEVKYLGTDPLMPNADLLSDVAVADGAQGQPVLGQWKTDGMGLYALDRRGEVQFMLPTSSADKLLLEVTGTQNQAGSACSTFDLILSIDGECLGHRTLHAGYGTNGVVICLLPYLKPGPHTVQIFWDASANFSSLRIQRVRLRSVAGADGNGNGIKDWVEKALFAESGHDTDLAAGSYVSPAFVEGRDPHLSMLNITAGGNSVLVKPNAGLRWYANVPLSAETNTPLSISHQNGGFLENGMIRWLPVNVFNSTNLVIRAGDSLLLSTPTNPPANVQITVLNGSQTVAVYNTTGAQPIPCQFSAAGTYTINAVSTLQTGATATGSITVKAIGYDFPANPVCMTSQIRTWSLSNVPPEIILESDPRVRMAQTNFSSLGLLIDQNQPRTLVARLGKTRPIVASATAQGLRFFGAAETYNTVIEQYPDGSRLVETMEVFSPVLTNITLQIRVIVGGVTFDDGTILKELTAADFDSLGQCKVRFLLPAGVQTSDCHATRIFQGSTLVGGY
jgi:hypothetical protein